MKKRRALNGVLALVTIVALIAGILPITASAEGELGTIKAFDAPQTTLAAALGTEAEALGLPAKLTATLENGSSAEIAVTWDDGGLYDKDTAGSYTFRAVLPSGYRYAGARPTATVSLSGEPMAQSPIIPALGDAPANGSNMSVSLAWVQAGCDGTVTGDSLVDDTGGVTKEWRYRNTINDAKLVISAQGTYANAPAGSAVLRLPLSLFTTVDGALEKFSINLPLKPATGGNTKFHYYIDDATKEIVITNYESIDGAVTLSAELSAVYHPRQITSGTVSNIKATMSYGGETAQSNTITARLDSQAKIASLSTWWNYSAENRDNYTNWQDNWGPKPANASDYIYQMWDAVITVNGAENYTFRVEDTPTNGEIVAWTSSEISENGFNWEDKWHLQSDEALNDHVFNMRVPGERTTDGVCASYGVYIITKVPIPAEGETITSKNSIKVTVTGTDIGDVSTLTATSPVKSYTYRTYVGDYYIGSHKWYVHENNKHLGAVNKLLAGQDAHLDAWALDSGFLRAFGLTKDADGNYGMNSYTIEFDEGTQGVCFARTPYKTTSFTNYNQLSAGTDYEFDKISFLVPVIYSYKRTEGGEYIEGELRYEDKAEIYTTNTSNVESKFGEVKYLTTADGVSKNNWYFIATATGDRVIIDGTDIEISLPDNTINVRTSMTTNAYSVSFRTLVYTLIHPTEHVKTLLNDYFSGQQANETAISVINYGDFSVKSAAGTTAFERINNFSYNPDNWNPLGELTKYKVTESNYKDITKKSSDQIREVLRTTLYHDSHMNVAEEVLSAAELEEIGLPNESEATFYDLLPSGTYIDTSSIEVNYPSANNVHPELHYSLSLQDNYAGTGRTLATIKVWDDTGEHYLFGTDSSSSHYYSSGWNVQFDIINPLENLVDNGREIKNYSAYTSPARIGNSENNFTARDDIYYGGWNSAYAGIDLDGDGTRDDTSDRFYFCSAVYNSTTLLAMQGGVTKAVTSPAMQGYGTLFGEIYPNNGYTYRLRYANSASYQAKNITFIDALEDPPANGGDSEWTGTFAGVDYSNATAAGIDVKVYYSTTAGLDPQANAAQADLTNTAIWTQTEPPNLADVKAVAFDCSAATGGGDFTLASEKSFYVEIKMQAPAYTEGKVRNAFYVDASVSADGGASWSPFRKNNNVVTSYMVQPTGTIVKSADPASGTEAEPAEITSKEGLTYKLSVTNTQISGTWQTATVTDEISSWAYNYIDEQNIKYYYADNPSVKYSVTPTGNLTWSKPTSTYEYVFTIKNLQPKKTMVIEIPVKGIQGQGLLKNTATLNSIDGLEVNQKSNTTYHKVVYNGDMTITKTASVNGGAENAGTAENPVIVEPGDTIEYIITVDNADQIVTSRTLTDIIPAGLTYVSASSSPSSGHIAGSGDHVEINRFFGDGEIAYTDYAVVWPSVQINAWVPGIGDPEEDANRVVFKIKCTVDATTGEKLFVNNARYGGLNGITSNNTYHKVEVSTPLTGTIVKSADPASGTNEKPAPVTPGSTLTYKLAITNTETTKAWRNAVVTDDMPESLRVEDIDQANIKYYYTDAPSVKLPVAGSADVSYTVSPNALLTFTLSGLAAGRTMVIEIPVTVPDIWCSLWNYAYLKSINGVDVNIKSNETWHFVDSDKTVFTLVHMIGGQPPSDVSLEFTYVVTVKDAEGNVLQGLPYLGEGGKADGVLPADGKVTLDVPEKITILGVPMGGSVSVVAEPRQYFWSKFMLNNTVWQIKNSFSDHTITDYGEVANFEHTYQREAPLVVSKTVLGEYADKTKEFTFTITAMQADGTTPLAGPLSYADDGAGGTIALTNGSGTFTLKDGDVITIYGVPATTRVRIVESDYAGYRVTNTVDGVTYATGAGTGEITVPEGGMTVAYTNEMNVVPTGIAFEGGSTLPIIISAILTAALATMLLRLKLKRKPQTRRPRH